MVGERFGHDLAERAGCIEDRTVFQDAGKGSDEQVQFFVDGEAVHLLLQLIFDAVYLIDRRDDDLGDHDFVRIDLECLDILGDQFLYALLRDVGADAEHL